MKTQQLNNPKLQKSKIDIAKKIFGGEGEHEYKKVNFLNCKYMPGYAFTVNHESRKGNVSPEDLKTCFTFFHYGQAEEMNRMLTGKTMFN